MNPQDQQKLESFINKAVRDLPSRRAPASLESRVQAEILRRASLPWWRKNFAHWPIAAKGLFVLACAAIIKVLFMVPGWVMSEAGVAQIRGTFAAELQWFRIVRRLLETGMESGQALLAAIPPLWLYGGIAIVVTLYLTLFGLGAAAYRTLYVRD